MRRFCGGHVETVYFQYLNTGDAFYVTNSNCHSGCWIEEMSMPATHGHSLDALLKPEAVSVQPRRGMAL